ncbi:hypothetical protein DRW07_07860 [Alteromonas sediminis]|uniref:SHOCT domain-containing protein n=1 Tax=Alteromonas sediminis TaxID=2259342 RepID=A0A3N5Y0Z8_9ALTE|nr:SHOCT domain-containing protein [Alteromonas sediminis]RPJ67427.1 hypothetical protein DRW07_07860 [Alteromonas sediminis]
MGLVDRTTDNLTEKVRNNIRGKDLTKTEDQMLRLNTLREKGILTEDEYNARLTKLKADYLRD